MEPTQEQIEKTKQRIREFRGEYKTVEEMMQALVEYVNDDTILQQA